MLPLVFDKILKFSMGMNFYGYEINYTHILVMTMLCLCFLNVGLHSDFVKLKYNIVCLHSYSTKIFHVL